MGKSNSNQEMPVWRKMLTIGTKWEDKVGHYFKNEYKIIEK
jgi:hypothetical protein